jgi:hypothetical protein
VGFTEGGGEKKRATLAQVGKGVGKRGLVKSLSVGCEVIDYIRVVVD